jgi:diguanylate cyclase (GGDEF)-like protein
VLLFFAVAVQLLTGAGTAAVQRVFADWLYDAVGFLAAATCFFNRRRNDAAPWRLIGIGILVWTLGDVYYTFRLQDLTSPPYPSLADAGYLAFYAPAFVGVGLLLRETVARFSRYVWLDGLAGACTICALSTSIVFEIVWRNRSGSLGTIATNLAYPAGDALLLAVVVGAFGLSGWAFNRTWMLLAAGLVLFAVGDSTYLVEATDTTYQYGSWLDLTWPAGFVLLAAAAASPPRALARTRLHGMALLVVPLLLGLGCLGIEIWDHYARINVIALAGASAGIAAIFARLGLTFKEHLDLLGQTERDSLTDALTGIGNRRALLRHLDYHFHAADEQNAVLLLFDLDGFKAYNDNFGHKAGDALLTRLGGRLDENIGSRGRAYRLGGDEFCVLAPGGKPDLPWLRARAAAALLESGDAFAVTSSCGYALIPEEAATPDAALQLADHRMYQEKAARGEDQTHLVLRQALTERDSLLTDHHEHVAHFAAALAREVGLGPQDVRLVHLAADLHDVGKLALPETLLQKPRELDDGEWALVRQHTLIGERIIAAAAGLDDVAHAVRSTHERWDGRGYPDGLAGTEIPLAARIIAICDAYSAITSNRPYRDARTRSQAIVELRSHAGSQFDPQLVELFTTRVLPALDREPTPLSDRARLADTA